jgi:hypothetical protein
MHYFDEAFAALLNPYPAEALDAFPGTAYGIDADMRLACANPAWFTFAQDNGGETEFNSIWGGRCILEAMAPVIREYYAHAYRKCLESGERWQHVYECSSADQYRRFHQVAYPLSLGRGLLLVNSLVIELPHGPTRVRATDTELAGYLDANGLICQCAHCRRVRNFSEHAQGRWDWIPEWVRRCPENTSHSFCPACYGHYYSRPEKATAS